MDNRIVCKICEKTFTQKSSLIRHSKRCTPGPAPSLRQKSCRPCTSSKTRCDLQRPSCSRCQQRGTNCEYIVPLTRGLRKQSPEEGTPTSTSSDDCDMLAPRADAFEQTVVPLAIPSRDLSTGTPLDIGLPYAALDPLNNGTMLGGHEYGMAADHGLQTGFCLEYPNPFDPYTSLPAPATQFDSLSPYPSSRSSPDSNNHDSLNPGLWETGPREFTPPLVKHSMETLLRVMKTWPKTLARGFQNPPMLHFTQTHSSSILWPLERCVAITKMWVDQNRGAVEMVRQTALQEMRALFEQYHNMDERHLVAALQALVMYTLIIMFPTKGQTSVSVVDPAIVLCLQQVVHHVAKTGLLLAEERDCVQPGWETWVHITAKRRAVLTLYLLHWSYSVYHNLQSFACSPLGFMPAPAPKFLWQAETREKWSDLYPRWLAQWGKYPYVMQEFAAIQPGTTLEQRTERWLEDADELGVLFFSVGTTVHHCVQWW